MRRKLLLIQKNRKMCVDKVGTICVGKNVTLKMKSFEVFEVGMSNFGIFFLGIRFDLLVNDSKQIKNGKNRTGKFQNSDFNKNVKLTETIFFV